MSDLVVKYEFITEQVRAELSVDILKEYSVLGVDTETTGLDPHTSRMLLIQVATPSICYIYDCCKLDIVPLLKDLFENPAILKIIQNAKFDYQMLLANYGIEVVNMFCTKTAERLITCGLINDKFGRASLKHLSAKYLGMDMDKTVRKRFIAREVGAEFTEKELEYSARDAQSLHPIFSQQVIELTDRGLIETAMLEFRLIPAISDMELTGCLVDTEKWIRIISAVQERRDKKEGELLKKLADVVSQSTIFGAPVINISSPTQLLPIFRKLGVKLPNGKPLENTDESSLVECAKKYPIAGDILSFRGDDKIVSSYGMGLINKIHKKTGRLHATFEQLGADTGRMSSRDPNLQQIPGFSKDDPLVDLRSCFIAPEGHRLVGADYCLAPNTRVLTAGGTWVEISTLVVGDELVGVEEYPAPRRTQRQFRFSVVERVATVKQPSYRLTMEGGTEIVCSALHRWLVHFPKDYLYEGGFDWVEAQHIEVGTVIGGFSLVSGGPGNALTGGGFYQDDRRVLKTEFLGEVALVGVQTSTRTFIAEGLVSHNSQQELRVLADASGDPAFSKAYLNGEDRHRQTAADVFGVEIDQVTSIQRTQAKTLNFTIIYGGGPKKIAGMLDIRTEEAQGLLDKYFKTYPRIKGFLNRLADEALASHFSSTISGRKRYFILPDPDDPDFGAKIARIRRQASNHMIQGSSADITKQAVIYTRENIRAARLVARFLMVVHDEIILEAPTEQAEETARVLEKSMIDAFSFYFKKIPMAVDATISDYWVKG